MYGWLIGHRLFGSYILNYREHRAVTCQTKVFTLVLLWFAIGYSAVMVAKTLVVKIVLVAIALAVSVHVLSLKTLTREPGSHPGHKARKGES